MNPTGEEPGPPGHAGSGEKAIGNRPSVREDRPHRANEERNWKVNPQQTTKIIPEKRNRHPAENLIRVRSPFSPRIEHRDRESGRRRAAVVKWLVRGHRKRLIIRGTCVPRLPCSGRNVVAHDGAKASDRCLRRRRLRVDCVPIHCRGTKRDECER
jgi:hypothetical protein